MQRTYQLSVTTQGPLYPPSEVMDADGNFIVIGAINDAADDGVTTSWGAAVVAVDSLVPEFGQRAPYRILERFDIAEMPARLANAVLHTLPLPLPCNNYGMVFAPSQYPDANTDRRESFAFHQTPIPDADWSQGRALRQPVTLRQWVKAKGELVVGLENGNRDARFRFVFEDLVPNSIYTIMTLREHDLDPAGPTRPAPLGIPNAFTTDRSGRATFEALLPDPFPAADRPGNRVINVVVLFMSYQMSHGGAIGRYGLGGDIHAQLKLPARAFLEFTTEPFPEPGFLERAHRE